MLLRKDPDKDEDAQQQGKQVVKESDVKPEKHEAKKVRAEVPEAKASIFTLSEEANKKPMVKEPLAEAEAPPAPTGEKLVPIMRSVDRPALLEKETPKVNLNVKGEKKSSSIDTPLRTRAKAKQGDAEEHAAPLKAPESTDESDVSQYMEDSGEEHVALNPEQPKKKPVEPVVVYREPEPVAIVNNTKSVPVVERPEAPRELPSIYSPVFTGKKEEQKVTTKFTQEQPDLSYVNPMHMTVQASTAPLMQTAAAPRPVLSRDTMLLFTQMVGKMTTLSNEGKTDTVMVLKHPPLFEGVSLKITAFQSARGEFNISFENLKPEALKLLQAQGDGLKMALQNKGFTVHILSATTVDAPIRAGEAQAGREQGEEQQRQQQQKQQQQQQQQQEE